MIDEMKEMLNINKLTYQVVDENDQELTVLHRFFCVLILNKTLLL